MRLLQIVCLLVVSFLVSSCDHYNDTIAWADHIAAGTGKDAVKKGQPDYVKIDWEHPQRYDSVTVTYTISHIDGNNDALNMTNELAFKNDRFIARWAHK